MIASASAPDEIASNTGATLLQLRGLALICAVDLHVMFDLPWLLQLGVELLSRVVKAWPTTRAAAISVAPVELEQIASTLGEDHGDVAAAVDRNRPHESLFAEVSQVAPARVEWPTVVVAQVARRDDAEAADEAERAGLRTAKRVLTITLADELSFESARQVELLYEDVSRIDRVTVAGVIATFP